VTADVSADGSKPLLLSVRSIPRIAFVLDRVVQPGVDYTKHDFDVTIDRKTGESPETMSHWHGEPIKVRKWGEALRLRIVQSSTGIVVFPWRDVVARPDAKPIVIHEPRAK